MFLLFYGGGLLLYLLIAMAAALLMGRGVGHPYRRYATVGIFSLFIVIPAILIAYDRWYFDNLCAKEGGTRINERVENVEGFVDLWGGAFARDLARLPYKYIEANENGKWIRYVKHPEGSISREEILQPMGRHGIREVPAKSYPKGIIGIGSEVVEMGTDRLLATDLWFSGAAGPIALWRARHQCPRHDDTVGTKAMLTGTLLPIAGSRTQKGK